jgi:hypothetical protein
MHFNSFLLTKIAGGGFDPPTIGLWVRYASSAPPRYTWRAKLFVYKT